MMEKHRILNLRLLEGGRRNLLWYAACYAACLLCCLVILLLLIKMKNSSWPPLQPDTIPFVTTTVNYASSGRMVFSAFEYWTKEPGDQNFSFHGQFFPVVYKFFMGENSVRGLTNAILEINVWTFLLCLIYFFAYFRRSGLPPALIPWIALFGAMGAISVQISLAGRPEHLIIPVLCISGMLRLWKPFQGPLALVFFGIEGGVVAAISPFPAVLLLTARFCSLSALSAPVVNFMKSALVLGGVALATWFLIVLAISPFSPLVILANTASFPDVTPRMFSLIHRNWFLNPNYYMIGIFFLPVLFKPLQEIIANRRRGILSWGILIVLLSCFALELRYGGVGNTAIYNITCLFPPCFAATMAWVFRKCPHKRARWLNAAGLVFLVSSFATSSGVLSQFNIPNGFSGDRSMEVARADAERYLRRLTEGETAAISFYYYPSLIFLWDGWPRLVSMGYGSDKERLAIEERRHTRIRYFFVPEASLTDPPPKMMGSFMLVEEPSGDSSFSSFPGYRFKTYERMTDSR